MTGAVAGDAGVTGECPPVCSGAPWPGCPWISRAPVEGIAGGVDPLDGGDEDDAAWRATAESSNCTNRASNSGFQVMRESIRAVCVAKAWRMALLSLSYLLARATMSSLILSR